ncbi:hypothetical protein [Bacillus phage vB_BanS-Thrax3]|nr:hypothetical protein [Bacillus phage vB_BanS-Thrax3]
MKDCGKPTGFRDIKGKMIQICDEVLIENLTFEVIVNPFTQKVVVDGDTGQEVLVNVFHKCEIVSE